MKLNKANNDGTIAVTIPKQIAKEIKWKAGQEVSITEIDTAHILITNKDTMEQRDGGEPKSYENTEEIVNTLNNIADKVEQFYLNIKITSSALDEFASFVTKDSTQFVPLAADMEQPFRGAVKQLLIDMVDRL